MLSSLRTAEPDQPPGGGGKGGPPEGGGGGAQRLVGHNAALHLIGFFDPSKHHIAEGAVKRTSRIIVIKSDVVEVEPVSPPSHTFCIE